MPANGSRMMRSALVIAALWAGSAAALAAELTPADHVQIQQLYARYNNTWVALDPGSGQPSLESVILADNPTLYYKLDEAPSATVFGDKDMETSVTVTAIDCVSVKEPSDTRTVTS